MSSAVETGCCKKEACYDGPGWSTPLEAMKADPEKILYIPVVNPKKDASDYLSVVDVEVGSPTYSTVIHRCPTNNIGDELHHTGWNVCSSCVGSPLSRDKLIAPSLNSDQIYVFDMSADPRHPTLFKTITADQVHAKGVASPHTPHCMPGGRVMISTMGKPDGSAQGSFIVLNANGNAFTIDGTAGDKTTPFGYDFWYNFGCDTLFSSEWGPPKLFKQGFELAQAETLYGKSINVWKLSTMELKVTIPLLDGLLPLEIRMPHDPSKCYGYVACALGDLSCKIFYIHKVLEHWVADKAIEVLSKGVLKWYVGTEPIPVMPSVITDMLISMDDKWLFFSNWVHGDIRMYDLSNPAQPKYVTRVWVGGSITTDSDVEIVTDPEPEHPGKPFYPEPLVVKGTKIYGGPQMLQLSLDGKRLYVTTSLYSVWDKQFYPKLSEKGACLLQIDVDPVAKTMKVNQNFLVDYGNEPGGPKLAHEIRYPGGDCTSDIFFPCPPP